MTAQVKPSDYAKAVAADVSRRYGVQASPEVVRIVAFGQFSQPYAIWDEVSKQLVYPNGAEFYRKTVGQRKSGQGSSPKVAARRDQLRVLHAAGATDIEIASKLGVVQSTVCSDRHILGLSANSVTQSKRALSERDQKILDMHAQGIDVSIIAAEVGLNALYLYRLGLRKLNITFRYPETADIVRAKRAAK